MTVSHYPALKWHPETGEAVLVIGPENDSNYLIDHHPADPDKGSPLVAEPAGFDRDRMLELLGTGGITYPKGAKLPVLRDLLTKGLQAALTGRGLDWQDDATAEALYAKISEAVEE